MGAAPLVDPDLAGQATHGRAGFDAYGVTIASPELPCGAAWLASVLLELGLPLWRPWGINDRHSWEPLGARRFRYRFPGSGWSRVVPGLVDGRAFRFRTGPVPQFTHVWPGHLPQAPRLILFVRDPRDALHSHWQRQRRSGALQGAHADDVERFLATPMPGMPLTPRQYLGLHLLAWRAASRHVPTLHVRFEDAKAQPRDVAEHVLRFLGIRASGRAIARAVAASDHGRLVEAERTLLASGAVPTPLLGAGRPHAHRSLDAPVALDAALSIVCEWLGYSAPRVTCPSAPLAERSVLLDWLCQPGTHDPQRLQRGIDDALAALPG